MRTLLVGDIHGCYRELQQLVERAGLSVDDRIIATGDIVDRGPMTPEVLAFFRSTPGASSLMGNHERKHVRTLRGEVRPALSQLITRSQIGEDAYPEMCEFMAGLPLYLDLPETLVVHAALEPGIPLEAQRDTVLTGTMSGERHLARVCARPWYELYEGPKPIVVGHEDYTGTGRPLVHRDLVYGLDTSCCLGGALTGLVLPEFELLSVQSVENYWAQAKRDYAELRHAETPDVALRWETAASLLERYDEQQAAAGPSARARAERLRELLADGEAALEVLLRRVQTERARILDDLRAGSDFDAVGQSERARLYSQRVGSGNPLAPFLFTAQRSPTGLSVADLRRRFRGPAEAHAFADRLGLEGD